MGWQVWQEVRTTMKTISRRQFLKMAGSVGALGLAASYPVFIERYIILTNTYRLYVPHLPNAFAGLRLVQLSDLHYGALMPLSIIEDVVRRSNAINADVILCTGDYVHEKRSIRQIDAVWPVLAQLKAPLGTFSVLGNHDHWADTARSQHWLTETGQDLRHKVIPIEKDGQRIWLVGAGDFWEDHRNLDDLLRGVPDSDCRIVLAHNPDTADSGFSERVDLMISGHTHGGQVNIPFLGTPILPVLNKTYSSGLKLSPKGLKVFISKGIGWAYYPVRFNCYPEIVVLELYPEVMGA
jgi:predicted MPP superfamily phosphohydrolase